MQCFECGHKNSGGVAYCIKCGVKLDMTADEIQRYYAQKVRDEKRTQTEFYARRLVYFSVVLLLLSITFLVMAGWPIRDTSYIPSATLRTEYSKMQFELKPQLRGIYIPEQEKR